MTTSQKLHELIRLQQQLAAIRFTADDRVIEGNVQSFLGQIAKTATTQAVDLYAVLHPADMGAK